MRKISEQARKISEQVRKIYGQVRKISPPSGFDPRTAQPVASRCIIWKTSRTHLRNVEYVKHIRAEPMVNVQRITGTAFHRDLISSLLSKWKQRPTLVRWRMLIRHIKGSGVRQRQQNWPRKQLTAASLLG